MNSIRVCLLVVCALSCCQADVRPPSPRASEEYREYLELTKSPKLRQTCDGLNPVHYKKLYEQKQANSDDEKTDINTKLLLTNCIYFLNENLAVNLERSAVHFHTSTSKQVHAVRRWMEATTKYVNRQLEKRLYKSADVYQVTRSLLTGESSALINSPPKTTKSSLFSNKQVEWLDILNPRINTSLAKKLAIHSLAKEALQTGNGLCSIVLDEKLAYIYHATMSLLKYMADNQIVKNLIEVERKNTAPTLYNLLLVTQVCQHLQNNSKTIQ